MTKLCINRNKNAVCDFCNKKIAVGDKIRMDYYYGWSGTSKSWDKEHLECFIQNIRESTMLDEKEKKNLIRRVEDWNGKGVKVF